jgi:Holliday junction resolvase RusA-like endonuclease
MPIVWRMPSIRIAIGGTRSEIRRGWRGISRSSVRRKRNWRKLLPKGNGEPKRRRKLRVLKAVLPLAALSVNKLYGGRKYRTRAYEKYRDQVYFFLKEYDAKEYDLSGPLELQLEVGFSSPLSDLTNSVKAIEDIAAEYFGFNDKMVIDTILRKYLVPKGEEYIKIQFRRSQREYDYRRSPRVA